MINEKDLVLFRAALRVGEIIFEYVVKDKRIWLEDRRGDGINPLYDQTEEGLFLEGHYGRPTSLWTPWGNYRIGGSGEGSWKEHMDDLLGRLGAIETIPLKTTHMGDFGPVYAINKIDAFPLPEPRLRERSSYLEYRLAKSMWKEMKAQLDNLR
ncbi:hypothetical protein J4216_03770 [Candidatus Woesearchaeota archaeon]|nr:hypothetical protein [Candidatus Woesearchaeota archaeon]